MGWLRGRAIVIVLVTFGVVSLLGGTLGAMAGSRDLNADFNLIGGPQGSSMQPATFVSCLPSDSWQVLYLWDGPTQTWRHFVNTSTINASGYINDEDVGGMSSIPRNAGVILMMNAAVVNAFFPDTVGQGCPS